ncbi:MAG: acyl-CoA thioesterase [Oscillospiraceae bacterium]|jgi:acyl-CoA hydrolase|nr:acyl-CoA thioesterase [Oscillospiraceae bacterium]
MTSQVHIVMPPHVNGVNRLFGGQLMAWIDVVAAVEARRHTHKQVVTVAIDSLRFVRPAFLDETVRLDACVTWTGRTSLEIRVDSYAEQLSGTQALINRAYMVFVALDENGAPGTFEPFVPQTPEEKLEWQQAELRRQIRSSSRA